MKKLFCLFFVILFNFQINASSVPSSAVCLNNYSSVIKPKLENPNTAALRVLVKMKTVDIEKMLGRKLKFKEKIALKILKFKNRKNNFDKTPTKDGEISQTLGIIGIISLFVFPLVTIPLAILAIVYGNKAKKENSNDKKAHTGIVLGWVTLGILVFAIIALIALVFLFAVQ